MIQLIINLYGDLILINKCGNCNVSNNYANTEQYCY
jgi:hypothetical protein